MQEFPAYFLLAAPCWWPQPPCPWPHWSMCPARLCPLLVAAPCWLLSVIYLCVLHPSLPSSTSSPPGRPELLHWPLTSDLPSPLHRLSLSVHVDVSEEQQSSIHSPPPHCRWPRLLLSKTEKEGVECRKINGKKTQREVAALTAWTYPSSHSSSSWWGFKCLLL